MNGKAIKALEGGLEAGHPWAVKLYFEYFYGKAKLIESSPEEQSNELTVTHIITDPSKIKDKDYTLLEASENLE